MVSVSYMYLEYMRALAVRVRSAAHEPIYYMYEYSIHEMRCRILVASTTSSSACCSCPAAAPPARARSPTAASAVVTRAHAKAKESCG